MGQNRTPHDVPSGSTTHGNGITRSSAGSLVQASSDRVNKGGGAINGGQGEGGGNASGVQGAGDGGRVEADNKELMHVLESTLITWTKQIKSVLKQVNRNRVFLFASVTFHLDCFLLA